MKLTNYKNILSCLVCLLILNISANAQQHNHAGHSCPMNPHPVSIQQTDGSTLTIVNKGSAAFHYTETADGYTLLRDTKGIFTYAIPKEDGDLMPSSIVAQDAKNRTKANAAFLATLQKNLRHNGPIRSKQKKDAETINRSITQSFPSTGNNNVLMILIEFTDRTSSVSTNTYDNLANQSNYNGVGSFKDYFQDNSFGSLILDTDVFGWYTANNTYLSQTVTSLAAEAIDAAEAAGVDFSNYDNDGNGSADGVVVVFAGEPSQTSPGYPAFTAQKGSFSLYGQTPKFYDGVTVDDFVITPEICYGTPTLGLLCHEFGHLLGLPDLYDIDYSSSGIGEYGVMGIGLWGNNSIKPVAPCAWTKKDMGWISPTTVSSGSFSLNPAATNASCYQVNTPNSNEYFLIENRQNSDWDEFLTAHGMAIWHIDDNQNNGNNDNIDENHKRVDLEEADGLNQLDNGYFVGDAGDLFPGSSNNATFNESSNPNSDTYNGANSNVCITNIVEAGSTVSFTVGCAASCNAPTTSQFSYYAYDTGIQLAFQTTTFNGQNHQFRYKKAGTSTWTTLAATTNLYSYTPNNLSICTQYQYQLRVQCPDGSWTAFSPTSISWTRPTLVTNADLSTPTVWCSGAHVYCYNHSGDNKKIRYRVTGGNWSSWIYLYGNDYYTTLSNLSASTNYQYDVRVKCGTTGIWSGAKYAYFTTPSCKDGDSDPIIVAQEGETEISVYPNPVQNFINIEISGAEKLNTIQIFDVQGRLVKELTPEAWETTSTKLDISDLIEGIYVIQINRQHIQRITKL